MSDHLPPPPPPPADDRPPPPPSYAQYQQYDTPPPGAGYGVAPGRPVDSFGRPLAEWWKRFVALLIDGFVLAIPTVVIFLILGVGSSFDLSGNSELDPVIAGGMLAATALAAAASLAYYGLLDGSERGQTLGKMALRIQVRDEVTGGPIGYGRGFLRHLLQTGAQFVSCIGLIFIIVDGLMPLRDPKRQSIHDKVAKTVVIDIGR